MTISISKSGVAPEDPWNVSEKYKNTKYHKNVQGQKPKSSEMMCHGEQLPADIAQHPQDLNFQQHHCEKLTSHNLQRY